MCAFVCGYGILFVYTSMSQCAGVFVCDCNLKKKNWWNTHKSVVYILIGEKYYTYALMWCVSGMYCVCVSLVVYARFYL